MVLIIVNEASRLPRRLIKGRLKKVRVTYRTIMSFDVLRFPQLCKDVLSEDFAELDAHLI